MLEGSVDLAAAVAGGQGRFGPPKWRGDCWKVICGDMMSSVAARGFVCEAFWRLVSWVPVSAVGTEV